MKNIILVIIAIKVLGLLYKIITTRMLGLDGMRLISMITPTLSLALAISSLSIQSVCNQNIASNINIKTTRISVIMLSCLRVTLLSSSIISLILLLSFPIYKYIYGEPFIYYPLLFCIPLLFFSNISGVIKGYLEATNDFNTPYISNLVESLTKILLTVILLIIFKNQTMENKIIIVFMSLAISELSSNIVLSYKIKHKRKIRLVNTNRYELKVLKQAIPLTLSSLIVTITSYFTPFIFYYACSKINVSLYEATTYIALVSSYAIPLLISGQYGVLTIAKFIFPSITKSIGNSIEQARILDKAFIISLIISVISFTICYFQSEFMLSFMFDDVTSKSIVKFLAPVFLLVYFDPIFITILQSYKKEKSLLVITIISEIISISSIYLLTINKHLNTSGYIFGYSIGLLLRCILLGYTSLKTISYTPSKKKIAPFLLISIVYISILFFVRGTIIFFIITILYLLLSLLFYYYLNNNKSIHFHLKMHK